jgi:hypothetical protein
MKTFLLKSLRIIESNQEEINKKNIPLVDGLIINREDDKNSWLIEALVDREYSEYFHELNKNQEEVMVEVRITKETNNPATFITSINSINNIGIHINIHLLGTMVDKRKSKIEEMLSELIDQGYQGEDLLEKFKELLNKKARHEA